MRNYSELLSRFGVRAAVSIPQILTEWEKVALEYRAEYVVRGEVLAAHKRLKLEGLYWNEQELKMGFLSALFNNLKTGDFHPFYERKFTSIFQLEDGKEEKVSCRPDLILSKKSLDANVFPCNFVCEVKPTYNPEFQLVKAMTIVLDNDLESDYICGCCIMGSVFKFGVLVGSEYYFLKPLDAANIEDFRLICSFILTIC